MVSALETEQLVARLAAAPGHFYTLLSQLEDADSVEATDTSTWSPHEIMAHLRAANDILEPRIFQVLVRDNTPLIGFEDARWQEVMRYASIPITDLLQTMSWRRKELVYALRGIPPEDWGRMGIHEVRGPMTVFELATQIAEHEDDHLAQIAQAIGK